MGMYDYHQFFLREHPDSSWFWYDPTNYISKGSISPQLAINYESKSITLGTKLELLLPSSGFFPIWVAHDFIVKVQSN